MSDPTYGMPWPEFKEVHYEAYLESLAAYGTYIMAADAVGCCVREIRRHRRENQEFSNLCDDALKRYRASFIQSAADRARYGVEKIVVGGKERNEIIRTGERNYSDSLMSLFLKRHDPAFRDSSKILVSADVDVRSRLDVNKLSAEGREKLRELLKIIKTEDEAKAGNEK